MAIAFLEIVSLWAEQEQTLFGTTGTFTLGAVGGTNNESLEIDFESDTNEVAFSSTTGVTTVIFNTSLNVIGGNVGIAVTNPAAPLDIESGGPHIIWRDESGSAEIGRLGTDNSDKARIIAASTYNLSFGSDGTAERAFLDTAGNFGIGTTAPEHNLHINASQATLGIFGAATDQDYSGTLRLTEGGTINWQGGYLNYDGSANQFIIGTHAANDKLASSDYESIIIDRGNGGNVGISVTDPQAQLDVAQNDAGTAVAVSNTMDQILFDVTSAATTADVFNITTATTSGLVFDINAAALNTGTVFDIAATAMTSGTLTGCFSG